MGSFWQTKFKKKCKDQSITFNSFFFHFSCDLNLKFKICGYVVKISKCSGIYIRKNHKSSESLRFLSFTQKKKETFILKFFGACYNFFYKIYLQNCAFSIKAVVYFVCIKLIPCDNNIYICNSNVACEIVYIA